ASWLWLRLTPTSVRAAYRTGSNADTNNSLIGLTRPSYAIVGSRAVPSREISRAMKRIGLTLRVRVVILPFRVDSTQVGAFSMAPGRILGLAQLVNVLGAAGCVDRRFVIESNIPNAQVFIDNKPIGAAPAYSSFEYYGYYTVSLVHPGYETLTQPVHVVAPWYAYPPFDFLTEV